MSPASIGSFDAAAYSHSVLMDQAFRLPDYPYVVVTLGCRDCSSDA
jgi:hypothetical protein